MKDEPVHELEHATPTVVQHHDEDMTVLGRWLQRGMEQGSRFWVLLFGVIAAVVGLSILASGLNSGTSAAGEGWVELIPAKTVDEKIKIAEEHPSSPVAQWARLQAAMEEYDGGFMALVDPKQRDLIAGAKLRKALGFFKQVAKDAPKDSKLAPIAALGVARTHEALNELGDALRQYKYVAETWKDSPEARQAEGLAKILEDPESAAFYKELYAATPPSGTATPDIPRPKIPGFTFPDPGKSFLPSIPNLPAPSDLPAPPPASAPPTPPAVEAPKVEPPKVEPPAKPAETPKPPAVEPSTAPPK